MTSRRTSVRDRGEEPKPVAYPTSDGKPMAETDLHVEEIIRLRLTLRAHFAGRSNVYVSGNLFCYYEEGNPRASFSPDLMVVYGAAQYQRDIYKLWEEPTPAVIIEVTSRKTRAEDVRRKRDLYERLGVAEYYLYDPRAEHLRPALQGYRLLSGSYAPVTLDTQGGLASPALGLRLALVDGALRLIDPATGQSLPDPDERATNAERKAIVETEARRVAERQAQFEAEGRRMAEQRAEAAEARAVAEAEARLAAEERADAQAEARRAAEERIRELERRLAALGGQRDRDDEQGQP